MYRFEVDLDPFNNLHSNLFFEDASIYFSVISNSFLGISFNCLTFRFSLVLKCNNIYFVIHIEPPFCYNFSVVFTILLLYCDVYLFL
jgi:hypothetical protein